MKQLNRTPHLLFLLALSSCIRAGHHSWESSARITMTDNVTSFTNKRWLAVEPREGGVRLWPDATIKYCFESADAKAKLLYHVEAARDRWYLNGLPEHKFQLTEVSATECQSNRASVLLIKYNDRGILSTTPGLPALDANDPKYVGPTMQLSDSTMVGLLEVVGNYAHEIGHAWGLLHEHQNLAFWAAPYSPGFSQVFTFNCQNLVDYSEVMGRITDPKEQTQLCTERAFAREQSFSASEYLPIFGGVKGPVSVAATDEDVDWDSIMLYPSGAGGTGSASPGNDQRNPVILRASDGSRLPINLNPSTKDVEGLKLLYETDWRTTRPILLNEPSNPKHSKFKDLFRRQKCA